MPCPTCGNRHDEWSMFWLGWIAAGVFGAAVFILILIFVAVMSVV